MKESCVLYKSLGRPLIVLSAGTSFGVKDIGYGEGDQREGSRHGALETKKILIFYSKPAHDSRNM